jgi:hypothetical protein
MHVLSRIAIASCASAAIACSSADSATPSDATPSDASTSDASTSDTMTVDTAVDVPTSDTAPDGTAADTSAPDAPTVTAGATWTLEAHPSCTSSMAPLCLNQPGGGGYQMAAGAVCSLNNALTIYLPGDTTVPSAGTYTVKPAATFADLINLPAGQAGIQVVYHPDGSTQELWWGQSGTVTVTNTAGKVGYSTTGVTMKLSGKGTATGLTATAQCPCTGIGCKP